MRRRSFLAALGIGVAVTAVRLEVPAAIAGVDCCWVKWFVIHGRNGGPTYYVPYFLGLLLFLLPFAVGCGSISVAGDAGKPDLDLGGSVDACPPTTLFCTTLAGACPQGQAVAKRSTCGGAPVAVCCPVNDCELEACEACPLCVP